MGFLDNLDPNQKKILMIGAPVVGIAAIYSLSRGGPDEEPAEKPVTDATGGSGVGQVGVIPGGQSTGAVGVGELSSFLENVSDALGTYKDENAAAIAALAAQNQEWQDQIEEQLAGRGNPDQQTPNPTPTTPAPTPQMNQYQQQVLDKFAKYGVALTTTHGPTTETPEQRVARIARSLESGTITLSDLDKSVLGLSKVKR